MQEGPLAGSHLDGVSNRMPEIQMRPHTGGLQLVFFNDPSLDGDVASDQVHEMVPALQCIDRVQHFRIPDGCVLDDLGEALSPRAWR